MEHEDRSRMEAVDNELREGKLGKVEQKAKE